MDKQEQTKLHKEDDHEIIFKGSETEKDAFLAQLVRANMQLRYERERAKEALLIILYGMTGVALGFCLAMMLLIKEE